MLTPATDSCHFLGDPRKVDKAALTMSPSLDFLIGIARRAEVKKEDMQDRVEPIAPFQ